MRVRKNDVVKVIAGKDKGKTGKVLEVLWDRGRVRVEKVQVVKRHLKKGRSAGNPEGGILERNGTISPDGHWLAYEADDSGRFEIYVRPYPEVNSSLSPVSTNGGTKPLWTRDGKELIYVSPTGALMSVGVKLGSTFSATKPSVVVKEGYFTNPPWWGRSYDVSPDGKRFLMIKEGGPGGTTPPASLVVVQHWFEDLKRLVPAN